NWLEEWNEFVRELARLGFVEGRNIAFERRFGNELQPEGIRKNAAELVALKVDLIYAARGSLTALVAKNATNSIPIVFFSSADPVGLGLVPSLSRPIGNVTGNSVSAFEFFPKNLQYLSEIAGKLERVVEITPSGTKLLPWFPQWDAAIQAAVKRLGIRFEYVEVESIEALELAVKRLKVEGTDAVAISGRDWLKAHQKRIAALLISLRIPSLGDPEDGFLLQSDPDGFYLARKAAGYVARILNGTKPSELPVEQVSRFNFVVNQKTAEAIGLKIPVSMLLRASKVIR
ncbi:MAG: ABC transporter substrate-binding protein, partial [Chloroflexia bacterium]